MSVPIASGASNAATAAADPPPDPPGMRSRSHGLWVGPNAECSVDEPIANSSMLVLPRIGSPAALTRAATVASYGGIQPSSSREPAVVGSPLVATMSLTAIGTPASGCRSSPAARRRSTSAADASAPSASTCRKACTGPSTAAIRSRWARGHLDRRHLAGPERAGQLRRRQPGQVRAGARHCSSPRIRGTLKRCLSTSGAPDSASSAVSPGTTTSAPEDVGHRQRVRGGWHVGVGDLAHLRDRLDDHRQLGGEVVELGVGQVDAGESRQVRDLVTGDASHAARV